MCLTIVIALNWKSPKFPPTVDWMCVGIFIHGTITTFNNMNKSYKYVEK